MTATAKKTQIFRILFSIFKIFLCISLSSQITATCQTACQQFMPFIIFNLQCITLWYLTHAPVQNIYFARRSEIPQPIFPICFLRCSTVMKNCFRAFSLNLAQLYIRPVRLCLSHVTTQKQFCIAIPSLNGSYVMILYSKRLSDIHFILC